MLTDIIDRFSKSLCLVSLPELPTAFETTALMFNHMFWYYGLPEDIVSYQGTQLTSQVWKNLMEMLGVTVSLTSDYHPMVNGQVEQSNQELGKFLWSFSNQEYWACFLPWPSMPRILWGFRPVHPFPVCLQLSTSPIPMECQPHGHSCSQQMVQVEWASTWSGSKQQKSLLIDTEQNILSICF